MVEPATSARPRVAILLAAIGGYVDAVGFLTMFGLFTAHLSGNAARLGVELGQGNVGVALSYAVPIVAFFAAVAAGTAFCAVQGRRGRESLRTLLAIEAVLVALFMIVGTRLRDAGELTPRSAAYYALAILAVTAMGLQTSSVRQTAGVTVHTTFITGMVVSCAEELVSTLRRDDPDAPRRARLHGSLVAAYLVGAAAGSGLESAWALWSLSVPLAALVLLAARPLGEPEGATLSGTG